MPFTDAERRLIAAGWSSASCDQTTYAAQHGVSARTLRSWVERYGAGDRPEAKARAIVERSMRELQDLLVALDAEAACRNGGGEGEVSRLALTDRAWFGETDRDLGVIGVGELSMCGVASVVRPN